MSATPTTVPRCLFGGPGACAPRTVPPQASSCWSCAGIPLSVPATPCRGVKLKSTTLHIQSVEYARRTQLPTPRPYIPKLEPDTQTLENPQSSTRTKHSIPCIHTEGTEYGQSLASPKGLLADFRTPGPMASAYLLHACPPHIKIYIYIYV